MKKIISGFLCVCILLVFSVYAFAEEIQTYSNTAENYNISMIKENYYNDFESGENLNNPNNSSLISDFTADGSQSFYNHTDRKNNTILDCGTGSSGLYHAFDETVTDGIIVYESQFFADWYNGSSDIEYERYSSTATVYGLEFSLYDSNDKTLKLTGLSSIGTLMGPNLSWGYSQFEKNKWYDIRITINTSSAVYGFGTMTVEYKKTGETNWQQGIIPHWTETEKLQKYIHIFDGTGQTTDTSNIKNNALLPSGIKGFGYCNMSSVVDDLVDNVSITVYNPLYKMMEKTETVYDVKSLLAYYEELNSINTKYESDYEVNYDAVYEALAGRTFESDEAVQNEFNRLCAANLYISNYEVKINNTTYDGKALFNVKNGDTFNTTIQFTNNTSDVANVYVINAMYASNDKLVDLKMTSVNAVGEGQTTDIPLTTTVPNDEYISHIKQFVIDLENDLKPYCASGYIYCVPKDYVPTLYIVGDSLCQNYDTQIPTASTTRTYYPYQGWGYYMSEHLDGIKVDNRARSGWTTEHFVHPENKGVSGSYLYYVWSSFKDQIKPGDYVLVGLGINDSASLTEDRYIENLEVMYKDTVNAGATPIYSTPTISGGTAGSESGWTYSSSSRWVQWGEICRVYAESKGAVCVPFGKTMSDEYETMYNDYMNENPSATVSEGRDYVRHYFHIYQSDLKSGKFGYVFTDEQINQHYGNVSKGDDVTHVNFHGAQKLAEIMCRLIKNSDCSLKAFVK